VIEQLNNNEAILLMYLAGELPGEDRLEVERMLASDAALRTQLDELQMAQDRTADALARLDATWPLPLSEQAAVRRTGRAIRQWLARPKDDERAAEPRRQLRYPWWAYPTAAAASIFVALLVWVYRGGPASHEPTPNQIFASHPEGPDDGSPASDGVQQPLASEAVAILLEESFSDSTPELPDDARQAQADAERELDALKAENDSAAPGDPSSLVPAQDNHAT